ncbi:MAG TPA: hypothetical protein VMY43_12495 [Methanothrix sp.]|jgi:hypothetical protein|nr:hypothetical protein [Methanothrix sp.]
MKIKISIAVLLVLLVGAVEVGASGRSEGFHSRPMSDDDKLVNDVKLGAMLLGINPDVVRIGGYTWGSEVEVFAYDDDIVAAGRGQEVANQLLEMATQVATKYPGRLQQIYVAVTCKANNMHEPDAWESHQCEWFVATGPGA